MMNGIEASFVLNNKKYGWKAFLADPSWKLKMPFVCALFYSICYYYLETLTVEYQTGYMYLIAYNAVYVVIAAFVLQPLITDFSDWVVSLFASSGAKKTTAAPAKPSQEKKQQEAKKPKKD